MGNLLSKLSCYDCRQRSNCRQRPNYNANNQFNTPNPIFRKVQIIKSDSATRTIKYDNTPPYFINRVPSPIMNEITTTN